MSYYNDICKSLSKNVEYVNKPLKNNRTEMLVGINRQIRNRIDNIDKGLSDDPSAIIKFVLEDSVTKLADKLLDDLGLSKKDISKLDLIKDIPDRDLLNLVYSYKDQKKREERYFNKFSKSTKEEDLGFFYF